MVAKKEETKAKSPVKKKDNSVTPIKDNEMEKILIENFVSLQKVMTNFAVKFDNLSTQMSKLLELFEISAKTMSEKGFTMGEDKKILEKLDSLLERNKVIAQGIALLHEKETPEEPEPTQMPPQQPMRPTPQMQNRPEIKLQRPTQMETSKPGFPQR